MLRHINEGPLRVTRNIKSIRVRNESHKGTLRKNTQHDLKVEVHSREKR